MNPRMQMMLNDPRNRFEDIEAEDGYSAVYEEAAEKMVDADFYNKFEDLYDVEDLD